MLKLLCISFLLFAGFTTKASFVPATETQTVTGQSSKTITLAEFEAKTGKKLNWIERIQYKKVQRMMAKGKMTSIRNAEELTEGFQFLPFIASFLTLGTVYLIMLFTAKDANAIRWARWGFFGIWLIALGLTVAFYISEGGGY